MKGKRKEREGKERKGEKTSNGEKMKREKGKGKKEREVKGGFVAVSTIHIIHNTISFFISIYILLSFLLVIMGMHGKEDISLHNVFKYNCSVT